MVVPPTTRLQFLVVRPDFGCPYLGMYKYTRTMMSFSYRSIMVVRRTTASIFWVVPGARTTRILNAGCKQRPSVAVARMYTCSVFTLIANYMASHIKDYSLNADFFHPN